MAIRFDTATDKAVASDSAYLRGVSGDPGWSLVFLLRLNSTPGAFARVGGRGLANGSISQRGWGILCRNGSTNRLYPTWCSGSTQQGIDNAASNLTTGVWVHACIQYQIVEDDRYLAYYFNGTLVDSILLVGAHNNTGLPWQWGADPQDGTGCGPFDLAEIEVVNQILSPAQVASLVTANGFKRLRDIGVTPANYHDLFTSSASANWTDKVGSVTMTPTGLALPVSTYIDHPPMDAPIIDADAAVDVRTTGKAQAEDQEPVVEWRDLSGRKLHLAETVAGFGGLYLNGNRDRWPVVWFENLDLATGLPPTSPRTLSFPSGVRFNPAAFTVEAVVVSRGWRYDFQSAGGSAPSEDFTFHTLWSVDGNTTPSTRLIVGRNTDNTVFVSGVARTANTANNGSELWARTGTSAAAENNPGAMLFCPTSPTLIIHRGGSSRQVGLNDLSDANTGVLAGSYAAAASSGQGSIGGNPSNRFFGFDGGFLLFRVYNRVRTDPECEARRDELHDAGYINKSPSKISLVMGSSSAWGQEASDGRSLWYLHDKLSASAQDSWWFNHATPRSRFDANKTYNLGSPSITYTVPSHNNHAEDTHDAIVAAFPDKQVDYWVWGLINDCSGDPDGSPQSAADTLARLKTFITNRRTAAGSKMRRVIVFDAWRTVAFTNSSMNDARLSLNESLLSDPLAGSLWTHRVPIAGSLVDDMEASAANPYTNDDKHPSPDGFMYIYELGLRGFAGGGASRCRSRSRARASAIGS